jgi:hypothetical protein
MFQLSVHNGLGRHQDNMSKLHKTLLFQKYCRRLERFVDNIFETERGESRC